jgi:hypothetical protein
VFVTTAATRIEKSGAAVSAAQIAIQTGLSQRETQAVLDGTGEPREHELASTPCSPHGTATTGWWGLRTPLEPQLQEPGRMDFETRCTTRGADAGPLLEQLVAIGAGEGQTTAG